MARLSGERRPTKLSTELNACSKGDRPTVSRLPSMHSCAMRQNKLPGQNTSSRPAAHSQIRRKPKWFTCSFLDTDEDRVTLKGLWFHSQEAFCRAHKDGEAHTFSNATQLEVLPACSAGPTYKEHERQHRRIPKKIPKKDSTVTSSQARSLQDLQGRFRA